MMCVTSSAVFSAERIKADVLPCESYLVLTSEPTDLVMPSNTEFLKPEVLTTIFNEKTQILVKTLKAGVSRLYMSFGDDIVIIEFNALETNEDKDINLRSKFVKAIVKIDTLENPKKKEQDLPFELDEPPLLNGGTHD